MSKLSQIQSLFKQLRPCLEDQMTPEQKKTYDKLSIIFKDLSKSQKQFGIQNNEQFFTSLKIQLYSLKKDVLNNKKANMSDYEIFLWKHQLYKNNKETFNYIEFTDIVEKITLPKRAINGGIPQTSSLAIMKDFSFCPLGRSINDIVELSREIIFDNSYCQKNFNKQLIGKLVHQMAKQYQVVSYHNFTHAFSVQLMLFQCMQTSSKLKALFTPFEAFIAYISALAHDIGHYGTNSDFEIKKKSQVAKSYSNQSVLENMHVAKFWRMLRKHPELDIISQIKDPVERQRSKRLIIRLILGTDVSKHFQSLSRYNSLQKQDLNSLSMLQKQVIHENLFHACDIGNCCLEFDDFMNWARLLSYEFNSQYEMELQSNVQPSAMFKYNGEKAFYQGQVGFIDFLAAPLWKTITETFPQLAKLSQSIRKNKEKLKKLIEEPKQK